jgi:hypothetical protein
MPATLEMLELAQARQAELMARLAEDAADNHSAVTALIALGQALIQSHPDPSALARSFLDQIDLIGAVVSDDQAERYRGDIQKINAYILDAVNRRSSRH